MFQATLVRDGQVIDTWKRTLSKTRVQITVRPLVSLCKTDRVRIDKAFEEYARSIERPPDVRWP